MLVWVKRSRKAIISAVVAGGVVLLKVMADDAITPQEWVEVLLAVAAGGGITYAVPNEPRPTAVGAKQSG